MTPDSAFAPRRVLAAVDFSAASRVSLTMALRLAAQFAAELHVVHVVDRDLCAVARADGSDFAHEVREEMCYFLDGTPLPRTLAAHRHVVTGPPSRAICSIASREQADVIVLASRGTSGASPFLGSTAESVLRHAGMPVIVVPETWTPPSPDADDLAGTGPVIAGIDFTAPSLTAMNAATRLAFALDARLELLHVAPLLPVIDRWRSYATEAAERCALVAQRELSRLARAIEPGVNVDTRVVTGLVAESIADAARLESARHPLLVLGRRGPSARGDAPGATAHRVIALAEVPTLVVPAGTP
jgi:nucleotide-binding universal stress UspA family protein